MGASCSAFGGRRVMTTHGEEEAGRGRKEKMGSGPRGGLPGRLVQQTWVLLPFFFFSLFLFPLLFFCKENLERGSKIEREVLGEQKGDVG